MADSPAPSVPLESPAPSRATLVPPSGIARATAPPPARPRPRRSAVQWRVIVGGVGTILLLIVLLMLVPAVLGWWWGESSAMAAGWGVAMIVGLVAGGSGLRLGRGIDEAQLGIREGYAIVTFGWLSCSLVGAIPFVIGGALTPLDGWFETISGFTTTGSSVVPHPEVLPGSLLLWRALMQWVGGLGIVVLSVAVLPALGVRGATLVPAEFSERERRLRPRMASTARRLWGLYTLVTVAQIGLMLAGGVSLFDATCHAFATLSGGGFSTHSDSVAAFHSSYIEWVVTVFMLVGGINFALLYGAAAHARVRALFRDPEVRVYLGTFVGAAVLVGLGCWLGGVVATDAHHAVRRAAFNTASMITTTGFATADFALWPGLSHLALIAVLFVGGCTGSTSGSIKSARIAVAGKVVWRELRRLLQPRLVAPIRVGDRVIESEAVHAALGYVLLYVLCWVIGTAVIAGAGSDVVTSTTAAAACLGNTGPGLAAVGPCSNFAGLAPTAKIACGALMLLGRLEIYSVLVLFAPRMWRR